MNLPPPDTSYRITPGRVFRARVARMNAIQIFLVVFVLLLAGAVGLWAALYALTAQRRRRYAQQVALVAGQLQGAGGDLTVIEQIAGQSSPDGPPPYGP